MFLVELVLEFLVWLFLEWVVTLMPARWQASLSKDAARAIVVLSLLVILVSVLVVLFFVVTHGGR